MSSTYAIRESLDNTDIMDMGARWLDIEGIVCPRINL